MLLAAFAEWGPACFQRFHGMWGLVIIDTRRQIAFHCRDRLGIKPLYYIRTPDALVIASEIKQLLAIPGIDLRPNSDVLANYLTTGYEQEGESFFENVVPLPPGTWLSVDLTTGQLSQPEPYWFPEQIVPTINDYEAATELCKPNYRHYVRLNLRSDVPVGCALSGGLDSSAVAALIAKELQGTDGVLQSFSVVFPATTYRRTTICEFRSEPRAREFPFGNARNERLPSRLGSVRPDSRRTCRWIRHMRRLQSGAVMRNAGVPVTLNGQGGDEILCGYWQSYFLHLLHLLRGEGNWRSYQSHFLGACLPGGNPQLVSQVRLMWREYRSRQWLDAMEHFVARQHRSTIANRPVLCSTVCWQ